MKESNSTTKQAAALVVTCALVVATLSIAPMGAVAQNVGTNTQAPTEIDSCTVIDQDGRYVLTEDIENANPTGREGCIVIDTLNVVLDGEGHTVDGTGTGIGIEVSGADNVTIANVVVSDWSTGIIYSNAEGNVLNVTIQNNVAGVEFAELSTGAVRNSTFRNNRDGISLGIDSGGIVIADNLIVSNEVGIGIFDSVSNRVVNNTIVNNSDDGVVISGVAFLFQASGNVLTGNVIAGNGDSGLELGGHVSDNLYYNNVFNNTDNVNFTADFVGTDIAWNVSKQAGPNIIGGPFVGGNYYAKPGGAKGYSEQCTDANGDGFCDQPYDLGGSGAANTDFLPLAAGSASAAPTQINSCMVIDQSGQYVLTEDIENANPPGREACIVINGIDVSLDGAGHTVDGVGSGIGISGRYDNATVTDIVVSDWASGITFELSESTVLNATIQNNSFGISFAPFSSGTVRNTTIRNNRIGIILEPDSGGVVMENNRLVSNKVGISIIDSIGNRIVNNTISDNRDDGVSIYGDHLTGFLAVGNVLTGNVIAGNGDSGLELGGHVSDNLYYNNVFNNTDNVNFTAGFVGTDIAWNVSKRAGTNIIGGPFIGGNYYAKPDGAKGYSERCTDANGDGFCDQPYALGAPNSTDYLPLTQPTTAPPDNGDDAPEDDGDDAPPDDGDDTPPDEGDALPDDGDDAPPDDGGDDAPDDETDTPPDDGDEVPTEDEDGPDDEEATLVCEAGSTDEVLGENDEDDDGDGAVDEDDEDNEGSSNDDDDGDGAIDEDDECDDGDDGSDEFNGNAEDDDDGDGAVDEDDEPDSGNSDDIDNDGDGAVDEDDEPDTDD